MGWFSYYKLLEKYDGDLSKATERELNEAWEWNVHGPPERALHIACIQWWKKTGRRPILPDGTEWTPEKALEGLRVG